MKFIVCEIENQVMHKYDRLVRTFVNSFADNCPSDKLELHILNLDDYPDCYHAKNSYRSNSVKLKFWADKVEKETENLCLIDGDTIVLKDMNHVFDLDFDIAYTQRSKGERLPINGGVLFIKPSEKVSEFMKQWSYTNNQMLVDTFFHTKWYRVYNGINQASFGFMLENNKDLKIISLPCEKYNACDPQNWENINDETHVIHIKSALREACLLNMEVRTYQRAIDLWKKYERPR